MKKTIAGKNIQTPFERKVFAAAKKIPRGKVTTYKELAQAIGCPNACRAVGNALNKNRDKKVPCHRVVKSGGSVGGFARGEKKKEEKLKKEGVEIKKGKIDLRGFGFVF